jgi:hypothetical protein
LQKIRNPAKLPDMNNPAVPHPKTMGLYSGASRAGEKSPPGSSRITN